MFVEEITFAELSDYFWHQRGGVATIVCSRMEEDKSNSMSDGIKNNFQTNYQGFC